MAVINQVSQHIAGMHPTAAPASSTITVHLNPDRWGEMKIAVKITDDESRTNYRLRGVEAVLTTSNPAVRAALLDSQQDLRSALEQSGLRLDKLDVVMGNSSLSSMDSGGNGRPNSGQPQSFLSGSAFGQGGATGNHSHGPGSGSGQPGGNSAALKQSNPITEVAAPEGPSDPASPGNTLRLVDYRI
jgi:flagellar hook-length control protein FliK